MAFKYTTKAGDTVDYIAWRHYGRQDGHVVALLLSANSGLADNGPLLPSGVTVNLPAMPEPEKQNGLRLWD